MKDEIGLDRDHRSRLNMDPSHLSMTDKAFKHMSVLESDRREGMADEG